MCQNRFEFGNNFDFERVGDNFDFERFGDNFGVEEMMENFGSVEIGDNFGSVEFGDNFDFVMFEGNFDSESFAVEKAVVDSFGYVNSFGLGFEFVIGSIDSYQRIGSGLGNEKFAAGAEDKGFASVQMPHSLDFSLESVVSVDTYG